MPTLTINISEEIKSILSKRADKNLISLKEQIEEILRKSAVRTKTTSSTTQSNIDDKLVAIFSRDSRGRKG
jgi:hypothetical protein